MLATTIEIKSMLQNSPLENWGSDESKTFSRFRNIYDQSLNS